MLLLLLLWFERLPLTLGCSTMVEGLYSRCLTRGVQGCELGDGGYANVCDFVQISDKAYVREQVLAMEEAILGKLEWYLTVPTPYMFLTRYVKASVPADLEMEKMVYLFAELGMMNYTTTIKYPPSLLSASSVYAARSTLNSTLSWAETLRHYTGYSKGQLQECAKLLASFHSSAPEHRLKVVYKKYSKPEVGSVALRPPSKAFCLKLRRF